MALSKAENFILRAALIGGGLYLAKITFFPSKGKAPVFPASSDPVNADPEVTETDYDLKPIRVKRKKVRKQKIRKPKKAGNLFQKIFKRKYLPDAVIQ